MTRLTDEQVALGAALMAAERDQYKREREEARAKLDRITKLAGRLSTANGRLQAERDEARAALREIRDNPKCPAWAFWVVHHALDDDIPSTAKDGNDAG